MVKIDKKKSAKAINKSNGPLGFVLFFAWIGALFYFEGIAYGFWGSVLAFLKSIVWPAYIVHAVLGLLHIH
ncbi:MAG TPA: hypothetical protein VLF90_04095 [Patescibacteria group bacterium]|nr:hypothetical protein [Patescibacteria group bacterium]